MKEKNVKETETETVCLHSKSYAFSLKPKHFKRHSFYSEDEQSPFLVWVGLFAILEQLSKQ